ncbi:MAG TPA: arginine--tRNA ligase [Bacteroidaceae bacterium]|nr:arginine--tRNA ligase [Bacteroidaceae bacterium]
MNIDVLLANKALQAIKALYNHDVDFAQVQFQKTKKEFEGHLTLVVFPFLKISRTSPEQTAKDIGAWLLANEPAVSSYNVIKGFLNIMISSSNWIETLSRICSDQNFGINKPEDNAPVVMIEYSSPNTNKPLHLGHVRNNLLGNALANIVKANGNRVIKTNIVNDRGIHICKSMLAWQKWGNGATPELTGKKGDHFIGDYYVEFDKRYKAEIKTLLPSNYELLDEKGQASALALAESQSVLMAEVREMLIKWERGDTDIRMLWEKMNSWVYEGFDETYKNLGVSFDKIYYESETYLEGKEKVLEGLNKGLFYSKDDGSVWADLTLDGLDHKLLLRSDGTSVYMTQDIGTAKMRFQDFQIDKMIYVVGNEQNYHFQVLSILLDRLGFEWGKDLVHFSYGMVELPSGKMKSREGTVVDADDLIDEMIATARKTSQELGKLESLSDSQAENIIRIVGIGALKYFILKVDARKNMTFNPQESIDFNGNTGPFIQYAYARIRSVLRKALEEGCEVAIKVDYQGVEISEKEISIIQILMDFEQVVKQAGKELNPSLIANYVYDLVKEFNQFYHDYTILHEPDKFLKQFRLVLTESVGKIIRLGMGLLGIEVPDRM